MPLPGPEVEERDAVSPRSAPTATGTFFVAGTADRGELIPLRARSLTEAIRKLGARQTYSPLYDTLDAFFRTGGNEAYISRVVGPAPTYGTRNLADGAAAVSLVATAKSPGAWSANVTVEVAAGSSSGTFILIIRESGTEVERTPDLVDNAAAVAWAAANSTYINLALGASTNDPAVSAAAALSAGTDDRASAGDTQWAESLARLPASLGPGQVAMPGRTTTQAHTDLINHAQVNNRIALLDLPDSASVSVLNALPAALRTLAGARKAGAFAPWVKIPGIAPGTTRTVPPSGLVAGAIARSDVGNSPNVAVAGDNGVLPYAGDLSQPAWTNAQRQSLNEAGVNVLLNQLGDVKIYGFRTVVDQVTQPNYSMLSNSRLVMDIRNRANILAETFTFDEVDGEGKKFSEFRGALVGLLLPYWTRQSLYGATPGEAFDVDTGPAVNTPTTIAAGEIRAVIGVRASPFAEKVHIDVVKVQITEAL